MAHPLGITSPAKVAINEYINQAVGLSDAPDFECAKANPPKYRDGEFYLDDQKYQVFYYVDEWNDTKVPGFLVERVPKQELRFGNVCNYLKELWSVRKLDNVAKIRRGLRVFGLTPVKVHDAIPVNKPCVLGPTMGTTNLDKVLEKDRDFTQTKEAWNKVKVIGKADAESLTHSFNRIRERCPITGEILNRDNAVLVRLKADEGEGCYRFSGKTVLMSRLGIKNVLLRTDDYNRTITRERLLTASFEQVTEANIAKRSIIARAWRLFWGGDVTDLSYNFRQADDRKNLI